MPSKAHTAKPPYKSRLRFTKAGTTPFDYRITDYKNDQLQDAPFVISTKIADGKHKVGAYFMERAKNGKLVDFATLEPLVDLESKVRVVSIEGSNDGKPYTLNELLNSTFV